MSGRRAKRERKLAQAQRVPRQASRPSVQESMPQRYGVLHYRGDVTSSPGAQPGVILGHDEVGRPYEVLDAEFDPGTRRTAVQVQYASPRNLQAAQAGGKS